MYVIYIYFIYGHLLTCQLFQSYWNYLNLTKFENNLNKHVQHTIFSNNVSSRS